MLFVGCNRKKDGEEFTLWSKNWDSNLQGHGGLNSGQLQLKREPGLTGSQNRRVSSTASSQKETFTAAKAVNGESVSETGNGHVPNTSDGQTQLARNSVDSVTDGQAVTTPSDNGTLVPPPAGLLHDYSLAAGSSLAVSTMVNSEFFNYILM